MPVSEQIKRAKKLSAMAQAYAEVFGSPKGKKVLHDILKKAHFIEPSYVRGDAHETSFREGERNQALRIVQVLNLDINELNKRIAEGEKEE